MNVDLLIKENKELSEEKQRYKEMWFTANNSLAKNRNIEKELGCPLDVVIKALKQDYIYEQGINVYGEYNEKFIFNKCKYLHLVYHRSFECFVIESLGYGVYTYPVKLSDYKKTWWLKEDRSE